MPCRSWPTSSRKHVLGFYFGGGFFFAATCHGYSQTCGREVKGSDSNAPDGVFILFFFSLEDDDGGSLAVFFFFTCWERL